MKVDNFFLNKGEVPLSKGKQVNIPVPGSGVSAVTHLNSGTPVRALGRVLFSI